MARYRFILSVPGNSSVDSGLSQVVAAVVQRAPRVQVSYWSVSHMARYHTRLSELGLDPEYHIRVSKFRLGP